MRSHTSLHRRSLLRLTLLLLMAFLFHPQAAPAQSADDVINAYLKARGGLAKIKSVQTERVTANISLSPGAEGVLVDERKRPLKMHMEITVSGKTFIRVYDGKSAGWIYNPFVQNPAVVPMPPEDLRGISDEADFEGPLVDYKAKGNQIEYAGKDEVEGKPAQKLKLTGKHGDVSYFFFDASTGLILKWQGTRKLGDKEVPWESYFRDFRDVDGLKYPFLVESGPAGSEQIQKIAATKVEINIPLDESLFAEPKPPMPPAQPADPAKPN